MIEEKLYIKEIWDLSHINDNVEDSGYDYQSNFIKRTTSEVMLRNDTMREFLNRLQEQMVLLIESTLVVRNFWNYTVNKYYDRHND